MTRAILFLTVLLLIGASLMVRAALSDPARHDLIYLSDRWPAGEPPIRLIFLSDIHTGMPDMPPERVARLVARINALRPDCVLIAGDFTGNKYIGRSLSIPAAIAPLHGLRPRIDTIAVLGNHDGWRGRGPMIRALADAGMNVVVNGAARCGPVTVGGIDDLRTGHADPAATLRAIRLFGGVPLLMAHDPGAFARVQGTGLLLAGHSHCGQVVPPLPWAILDRLGLHAQFACGAMPFHRGTLIVTAGIGTSRVPLRWGAPPDFWVISVGPRASH